MHRRARFRGDDLGLNCRQLCISGSAPALQVGGSSRSSTPAKAKRRSGAPHAGLVGQLSSTFAAPLEECSTLDAWTATGTVLRKEVRRPRLRKEVRRLRKGWSMDEAMEAIPLLGDLWQAGLLYVPGDTARTAVASALATLVSGGRRETPPGSAFGCALSRPSSTGSGVAARENMEQRLKRWCRSCEIFESAASMDLLTREGLIPFWRFLRFHAVVQEQLYEELKRTLAGAREEDLRKAASKIKLGSVPLCRACGLLAKARRPHPSSQISTPGSSDSESVKAASDAAAETISGIAFEVVRNTETASGETATSARAALEEHGVVERRAGHERITSTSRPSLLQGTSGRTWSIWQVTDVNALGPTSVLSFIFLVVEEQGRRSYSSSRIRRALCQPRRAHHSSGEEGQFPAVSPRGWIAALGGELALFVLKEMGT
eukprot:g9053.t1